MVARCSPCPAAVARKNGCGKKAVIGNSTLLLLATSSNTFPFARHGQGLAIWQKHGPKSPVVVLSAPVFPGALTEVFRWMWPIREVESGIPSSGNRATRASGSHPDARRSQRIAGADHDDWDHEAVRFERHAPGTASCGKTLALDMIEALNSNFRKPYV